MNHVHFCPTLGLRDGARAAAVVVALAVVACVPVATASPPAATADATRRAGETRAAPTQVAAVSPTAATAPSPPRVPASALVTTIAPCGVPPGWPSDGRLEPIGRHLRASFDGGKVSGDSGLLYLRFHVPESAPRAADLATSATVTASGVSLAVTGYLVGRPYAGAAPAGPVVRVAPCETMVLVVLTAPYRSGDIAITLREIQLPEFVTVSHRWSAALSCATTGPELTCTLAP